MHQGSDARENSGKYEGRLVFSVPEAGELLGLGRSASYEAARRGEIPALKIGGRYVVPKIALERLLASAGHIK